MNKGSVPDEKMNQVLITRVFDAPRALVFKAWTTPESLESWFAPNGCTVKFERIEIRPGGEFHSCIRSSEGHECWCRGVYHEVLPPERIVFSMAIANKDGKLMAPSEVGMDPAWPRETIVTVTFAEVGNQQTRVTLHQTVLESLARRTGAYPSWLQMLDKLEIKLVSGGQL